MFLQRDALDGFVAFKKIKLFHKRPDSKCPSATESATSVFYACHLSTRVRRGPDGALRYTEHHTLCAELHALHILHNEACAVYQLINDHLIKERLG